VAQPQDADVAIDAVYRSDWGRSVAILIRLAGDLDVAEEAVQEAFAAVNRCRAPGVPESPRAWLIRRIRHRAVDRPRHRTRFAAGLEADTCGRRAGGEVQVQVRRFRFPGGREAVKWRAAQAALDMLGRALLRVPAPPR
jgi:DNA-directed RNA polymerase specialized sigma24 family protein